MTTERWTDDRLDKLADGIERLMGQLDQLSSQLSQLGSRVEQTCERVDGFVAGKRHFNQSAPAAPALAPADQSSRLLPRLTTLESQMQQVTQRLQYLERREATHNSTQVKPSIAVEESDDEIEDEPDEILWDFFDPTEQRK